MASSQAGPLAILRETPLFRDMAPARFVRLLGAMEPLAYRAGEVVARAGEPAAGLLLAAQQDKRFKAIVLAHPLASGLEFLE